MAHHPLPIPLNLPDFDRLTKFSAWSWIAHLLGWHIPALSDPSKRITAKTFDDYPRGVQKFLFRSDLLPHHLHGLDSFDPLREDIKHHYSFTWALRSSAIRDIHRLFREPNKNKVERYSKAHQLWLPESELRWLKIFEGGREAVKGLKIDYPLGLRLTTSLPSGSSSDLGELKSLSFTGSGQGFWPLSFGVRMGAAESARSIQFNRSQIRLKVKLPKLELGRIWIENGSWGPFHRILFRKTAPDDALGILIWPQLPGETSLKTAQPTPRIPVYRGDVVELAPHDRILVFLGSRRGFDDAVIQINVFYQWLSARAPHEYAETRFHYPNPCERYPHCLRRPIYSPEAEVLEELDPPTLEILSLSETYQQAKEAQPNEDLHQLYLTAQTSVLADLRRGIIPEVVKRFMSQIPPPDLSPSPPAYLVEFPPEPSERRDEENDEEASYVVLEDVEEPTGGGGLSEKDAKAEEKHTGCGGWLGEEEEKTKRRRPPSLSSRRTVTFSNIVSQQEADHVAVPSPSLDALSSQVRKSCLKRRRTEEEEDEEVDEQEARESQSGSRTGKNRRHSHS